MVQATSEFTNYDLTIIMMFVTYYDLTIIKMFVTEEQS